MARTFTVEEANALIPHVARVFTRTTQMLMRLHKSVQALAAVGLGPSGPGQLPDPAELDVDPELLEELDVARMLEAAIFDEVRGLEALGIAVRDVGRGLVDFRSVLDGEREVWLCWRLGEPEIRFYHELEAGFAGRRPIEGHRFFKSRQLRASSE